MQQYILYYYYFPGAMNRIIDYTAISCYVVSAIWSVQFGFCNSGPDPRGTSAATVSLLLSLNYNLSTHYCEVHDFIRMQFQV